MYWVCQQPGRSLSPCTRHPPRNLPARAMPSSPCGPYTTWPPLATPHPSRHPPTHPAPPTCSRRVELPSQLPLRHAPRMLLRLEVVDTCLAGDTVTHAQSAYGTVAPRCIKRTTCPATQLLHGRCPLMCPISGHPPNHTLPMQSDVANVKSTQGTMADAQGALVEIYDIKQPSSRTAGVQAVVYCYKPPRRRPGRPP